MNEVQTSWFKGRGQLCRRQLCRRQLCRRQEAKDFNPKSLIQNPIDPLPPKGRPDLPEYRQQETVWVKYQPTGQWFKGCISQVTHQAKDFIRVWCDAVGSWGLLIDSPDQVAPGHWVLGGLD